MSGGGLLCDESVPPSLLAALTNNTGVNGGGATNWGIMTLTDSTVADNVAGRVGGGLNNEGGDMTIRGASIANNAVDLEVPSTGARVGDAKERKAKERKARRDGGLRDEPPWWSWRMPPHVTQRRMPMRSGREGDERRPPMRADQEGKP